MGVAFQTSQQYQNHILKHCESVNYFHDGIELESNREAETMISSNDIFEHNSPDVHSISNDLPVIDIKNIMSSKNK